MAAKPTGRERPRPNRVPDTAAREKFLAQLAAGWSATKAAAATGIAKQRYYELRKADETFAAAWEQAYDAGTDRWRDAIRERGLDGWDEPVYQGGKQVGTVRKFSDTLLLLEMKRRDPAYRDNHRVELTGKDGGPIQTVDRSASLAEIAEVLRETGALTADDSG